MRSTIIGLLISTGIVVLTVGLTSDNPLIYLNLLGLLIVVGGTISASVITFGFKDTKKFFKIIGFVMTHKKHNEENLVNKFIEMSQNLYHKPQEILKYLNDSSLHPMVRDGLRLVYNKFDHENIDNILKTKTIEKSKLYQRDISILKTLAKYPPSFGMMGTVIGLVSVLEKMGTTQGLNNIGPNMAIALITTLYGLFLSHYFLLPLSENLLHSSQVEIDKRKIIHKGILLLSEREDPVFVKELLVSYLRKEAKVEQIQTKRAE